MDKSEQFETPKREIAEHQLQEYAPLLILSFLEKTAENESTSGGVLFATKSQKGIQCWKTLNYPPLSQSTGITSHGEESLEGRICSVFVGIGNYGQFQQLSEHLKNLLYDAVNVTGYNPETVEEAFAGLAGLMAEECRSAEYEEAYSVELAVVSFCGGNLKMFRLKYDGDYHETNDFCVIGGYQTVEESGASSRKNALRQLEKLYAGGYPNLQTVQAIAQKILDEDPSPGKYEEANVIF